MKSTYEIIVKLQKLQAQPWSRYQEPESAKLITILDNRAANGDARAQDWTVGA